MENTKLETTAKIETPIEKVAKSVCRNPLNIITAILLLAGGVALNIMSQLNGLALALLILYLIATCVSTATSGALSFKNGSSLSAFIVFTVLSVGNLLVALFPDEDFLLLSRGNFSVWLVPENGFFPEDTLYARIFLALLCGLFLLTKISGSSLKKATVKNLPIRKAQLFAGIMLLIVAVLGVVIALFCLNLPFLKDIYSPAFDTYYIMYTCFGSFIAVAVAAFLQAIHCFITFRKLRKLENAF